MPQLNPSPWFAILFFSWLVFVAILPAKVVAHLYPNQLASQDTETPTTIPWHWPWR
uniref:ATP synthase complex subunit 8 n=1 Tax=Halichoeres hartzfeldii TaxID=241292 RepID=A0A343CWC7_9LABR|nr:ATP synthase F0 subunit 8 [Halichoeres hartzfeldii]ARN59063.1 ATP synthase F0 subunit 8 [Halichoeres hartzfeldii]